MLLDAIKENSAPFLLGALVSGGGWMVSHEFGTGGKIDSLVTLIADVRADVRDLRSSVDGLKLALIETETLRRGSEDWTRNELTPKLHDIEQRLRDLERPKP